MALFSNLFIDGVKYEKDDVKNKNICHCSGSISSAVFFMCLTNTNLK